MKKKYIEISFTVDMIEIISEHEIPRRTIILKKFSLSR